MKNTFRTILPGLALASLLVSCQKEMDTTTTVPVGEMVPVTFSAKVGSVTKVSLTPNAGDTSFTSAWEDGDGMKLYYLNGNYEEDTVDATYDETNNKWDATLPNYKGEWNYVASYPAASAIPFGAARTQTGNAYNPAYDIMQGEVNVTSGEAGKDGEGNDIVFPMERLTAIQYFHFTSDLDEKVYKATLSVGNTDSDIAATTVNISAGALVVATGGSKSITITFPDGLEPNASDFKLWFNVLPSAFTSMTIDIETAYHTKHIERVIGGGIGEYEAGKLYKASGKISDWDLKDIVFIEARFDDNAGTGGNDGQWSGSIASNTIALPADWEHSNGNGADRCIKLGSGSKKGTVTTSGISVPSPYRTAGLKLSFRAAAWNGSTEQTTLVLSASNATLKQSGSVISQVTMTKGAWGTYDVDVEPEESGDVTITFAGKNASDSRFFLDDVCVYYGTKPKVKEPAGLAYAVDNIKKVVGDDNFTNALTNPHGLTVNYSSDNITVAEVNSSTGEVTIKAVGTAYITASSEATADYTAGEATYKLTVSATAEDPITETIDFESAQSTYTSFWTFSSFTTTDTAITAHGGSKYCTTGGTTTWSVKTKNKIPTPKSITFYVSKTSNNTTTSNWKVQYSSNGSDWTDAKTASATSMSKGNWNEVTHTFTTQSNVYVRIYYDGTTAVRTIDDISFTYVE